MLVYIHSPIKNKKATNKKGTTTMDTTQAGIEPVTISDVMQLATWDRPRTNEELRDFISQRASFTGL